MKSAYEGLTLLFGVIATGVAIVGIVFHSTEGIQYAIALMIGAVVLALLHIAEQIKK